VAEYCTEAAVETRLRVGGAAYINDDNPGFLDQAISDAGFEIDKAVCNQIDPVAARAQANGFLSKCCVDLSVVRCFGGDEVPASFQAEADNTRRMLTGIEAGDKIPGFTYPSQPNGDPRYDVSAGLPLVVNPGGRSCYSTRGRYQ